MAKVITFGCRLNACESDIIAQFAQELGIYDYTIINTCAVTSEAERQLRQEIRKLYRQNPQIKIILTGCASELFPDFYLNMDGVVGVISNKYKLSKQEYLSYSSGNFSFDSFVENKVRGFLQIQNGCDNQCTYCIVRLTRGNAISFTADEIVYQAQQLLNRGFKEIVLTGVNISSYGKDFSPQQNISVIIRKLLKDVPGLRRLRLSSVDPADIDEELISLFANEERIMPHLHESIQSGDNMILKRMRRNHTREMIIDVNNRILEKRKDTIFGADIIAGFPTETDEMFENSLKLLDEAHISLLHAFPYSKRPGTPAALMPQVLKKISISRAKALRSHASELLSKKMNELVGKSVHILAETETIAKTDSFLLVESLSKMEVGKEYDILCEFVENNVLKGRL